VGTASASGDNGAALAQSIPLPVAVDQDTALVKDTVQKKWRLGLHPLQAGNIDVASTDASETRGKLVIRRWPLVGE